MKEKTLSEKIFSNFYIHTPKDSTILKNVVLVKDLKQALKRLQEEFPINCREHHKFHIKIKEIFGDEFLK